MPAAYGAPPPELAGGASLHVRASPPAAGPEEPSRRAGGRPTVAIVTVNYNGRDHLADCFDSLRQLDYPRDRFTVVCVDNASADGSVDFIRDAYPEVVLIESGANLGFAAGCNLGAEHVEADHVAFLNNDAKVDPAWLGALVDAVEDDPATACAGAKILDWEGRTVDFVEGHLNFHGFARQAHWRAAAEPGRFDAGKDILFACGGAMLVRRDVYRSVGGFDPDYFMFFEDVDLGWRLWVMGYRVVFAPRAITYHRHHGSAGKLPMDRRNLLYERNALFTIIKNYDQVNLDRILPAALMLAVHRATDRLQHSARGLDDLSPDRWPELAADALERDISYGDLAALVAIRDVSRRMPELLAKRRVVQARRARRDDEIFPLFGQPFRMYPMAFLVIQAYCDDHHGLVRALGLDEAFGAVRARVMIVCGAGLPSLGFDDTPEGRRAEDLGRGLEALGHPVLFSLPRDLVERHVGGVPAQIARFAWNDRNVDERIMRFGPDVVVATHWRVLAYARLSAYRPVVLDAGEGEPDLRGEPAIVRDTILRRDYLANVDLFIAPDEAGLAALRERVGRWAGVERGPRHWRAVPARRLPDGAVDGIAPLADFCQRSWVGRDKLPVDFRPVPPPTPIWRLPQKALAAYRRHGRSRLMADLRQYTAWRMDQLRHHLGG